MKQYYKILIILINFFLFTNSNSQTVEWINQFGGEKAAEGTCIKVDNKGNVFVAVDFSGHAWAGAVTPYDATLSFTSIGYFNMFIAKYDNSGNLFWAKQIKSRAHVIPQALSPDENGNSYLTGWIRDTTYFDDIMLVGGPKDSLYATYFIAKYNADGVCLWAKQAANTGSSWGNAIAVVPSNDIYTTGLISGKTSFGNNSLQPVRGDIFLAKYKDNGTLSWVKTFGGSETDEGISVSAGTDGSLYLSGRFAASISFCPVTLSGNENQAPYAARMFLVKLDTAGNALWGVKSGGAGECRVSKITLDHNNNILVTGTFQDSVYFYDTKLVSSRGKYPDVFFAKFDPEGKLIWVKQIKGGEPYFDYTFPKSVAADKNNNSYLYGAFSGFAVFDTVTLRSTNGKDDLFLAKYDPEGNLLWLKRYGGEAFEQAYDIDTDNKDNVYISGSFTWSNSIFDSFNLYIHGSSTAFYGKISYNQSGDIDRSETALSFQLLQNYPNPFNPITTISYSISKQAYVELKIYDLLGREVTTLVSKEQSQGEFKVQFDGSSLPSGIYVYTIQAGQYRDSKKLVLLK